MEMPHHHVPNGMAMLMAASREQPAVNVYGHDGIVPDGVVKTLSHHILVIDDSVTVRKIVTTCLQRAGFDVLGFADGVEALRWLTEPGSAVPDPVLLDIGLPDMDGYEVARRLKSTMRLSKTVIVMLSRRDGMVDRPKGRLVGANDFLVKPFQVRHLLAVVETYLGKPTL